VSPSDPFLGAAYGPQRVGTGGRPLVELVCGDGAGEAARTSPVPPVATVNLMSDAERAEMLSLQEGFRQQLRAAGRTDLLPAAEGPGVAYIATGEVDSGVVFDQRQVDRVLELMERARRAAVVFYRPEGRPD
jgi:hypothetical protein